MASKPDAKSRVSRHDHQISAAEPKTSVTHFKILASTFGIYLPERGT